MALKVQKATALPAARIGVGMISDGYVYPGEVSQNELTSMKNRQHTKCIHDEGVSNEVNKHKANSESTKKHVGIA